MILNYIKNFFTNLLLLIVALILIIPLFIWGIIELILNLFIGKRFWKGLSKFGDFIRILAIIIDMVGNVVMQVPFNRLLTIKNGYEFGNRFDTISFALGKNKINKTLSKKGIRLCNILNWFDTNHCINSVKNRDNVLTKNLKNE